MKKTLLVLGFVSSLSFSFAQSVKFGIKAGANLSSFSNSYNNVNSSSHNLTGFHVGGFAELGLGAISIQPGLLYTTKGGHYESSQSFASGNSIVIYQYNEELSLNYLEVPVNIFYHIPVGVGKLFIGGGPYIAFGISGKDKFSSTSTYGNSTQSSNTDSNVTFGSNSDNTKNPDYGINILEGLTLKNGVSFSVGYGFGLNSTSNQSGYSSKNNAFSLSIGYTFL